MPEKRDVTGARIAAGGAALVAVLLVLAQPTGLAPPSGWWTPIMALELARSPDDLSFLAGPDAAVHREGLRILHIIDMVFAIAYGALLVAAGRLTEARSTGSAAGLAILADWLENAVIFAILGRLDSEAPVTSLLPILAVATWTKWNAIAVGLASTGLALWGRRRGLALWLVATGCSAPLALVWRSPVAGELMGVAIVAGFIGLAVLVARPPTA